MGGAVGAVVTVNKKAKWCRSRASGKEGGVLGGVLPGNNLIVIDGVGKELVQNKVVRG